jgi:hypothetical protein
MSPPIPDQDLERLFNRQTSPWLTLSNTSTIVNTSDRHHRKSIHVLYINLFFKPSSANQTALHKPCHSDVHPTKYSGPTICSYSTDIRMKTEHLLLLTTAVCACAGPARMHCGETKTYIATNQCGIAYGGYVTQNFDLLFLRMKHRRCCGLIHEVFQVL